MPQRKVHGITLPSPIDERKCLAKTHIDRLTGKRYAGMNVFCHSRISGLVAMELFIRQRQELGVFGLGSINEVGALGKLGWRDLYEHRRLCKRRITLGGCLR